MKIISAAKTFVLFLLAIVILYGCKKDDKPVITTSDSYKGDITKSVFTPPSSYSPFQTFTEKIISLKTYSNKSIEVTIPADVSISYSSKYELNTSTGAFLSYKKSGGKAIRVIVTPFSNNIVQVNYLSIDEQTKQETNYIFAGKKM